MKKDNTTMCHSCGRTSTEYQHGINRTLISCLRRLHDIGGVGRLDTMGLSNTQFGNFQKLQYFRLVHPTHKNNEWAITKDGECFLQGRIQVPKFIVTKNTKIIRRSPDLIFIDQIKDCVEFKISWQKQKAQLTLFDVGGGE